MATILELFARGELEKIDPQLAADEMEERQIFLVAGVADRLNALLNNMVYPWDTETTPAEQLDELVYHYATGGALDYPRQFHNLVHARDGIWELKTPDLRLFGWFPVRDCFICSDIADANVVKQTGQYAGYCEQAWFRRERLDLDEPKFLTGEEPSDVVSNCYRT